MSVGILLVTHSEIGTALLNVALSTFEQCPIIIEHFPVCQNPDPDRLIAKAAELTRKMDTGHGVLVLTDMFGSTPANVAQALQRLELNVQVIAGLNLPMLFRVLNYPHLGLKSLAKKAVEGGKAGIFETPTLLKSKKTISVE